MLVKHFSTKKSYYKLDKLFSKIIDSIPVPDDNFKCVVDLWVASLVFDISVFELEIHFSVSLGDLNTVNNYGSYLVLHDVPINLNYSDSTITELITLDQALDKIKDDIKWYIDCREEVKKLKKRIYITVW
jgi:hypothetical protein